MTSFEENLLVEALGLILGLLITYVIVERLLRRAEVSRWKPVRERVIHHVNDLNRIALIGWAATANPKLLENVVLANNEAFAPVVTAFRTEVGELGAHEPLLLGVRPDNYWLNVARGLGSSREFASDALDRAQLAFRNDTGLVDALMEMEQAHKSLSAFRADEENFAQGRLVIALPSVVLRTLRSHLTLFDVLEAVPE